MQINIPQPIAPAPTQGKVVIAQHLKRERVFLDREGNEIDPRTKQILRKNEGQ